MYINIVYIETLGIAEMDIVTVKKCDSFKLDFDTLTKKQQKAIKRILLHETRREDEYEY